MKKSSLEARKIYLTFACFAILFIIVAVKAFYVQVVNGQKLIDYSNRQFFRQSTFYPKRGHIYDRNGSPLALNIQYYGLFTIPKQNEKQNEEYKKLSKIVPELKWEMIKKKISKRKRYTWLIRRIKLDEKQISAINKIESVFIEPEIGRYYPNHELLSQILGFVGIDNVGLSGVEFKFDEQLKGEAQKIKYLQDAKGRPIKFESIIKDNQPQDLHLSIDKDLQSVVEKYLKEAVEENAATKGGIGVLDSETGEVLAMANYPSFDPNHLNKSLVSNRRLSFVSDPFEPGSIFKVFTVLSALENKILSPDTHFFCEYGRMKIDDHMVSEAESSERFEWLSVSDIIKYSSNIGTTKIAFDLTFPLLKNTLNDFRFGLKTGIEIPGESRGILTSKTNISSLSLSNISFGQGIATTGIQMLAAYGVIANGGYYINPTIIKRKKNEMIPRQKIINQKSAEQITTMLIEAVDKGTGSNARIPYFKIAGKTGTAQSPSPQGGYNGYVSGFVGFPLNVDKKFVIMVYVDRPSKKNYYGNLIAAPIFKNVAQYLLYKNKEVPGVPADHLARKTHNVDAVRLKEASWRELGQGIVPNFLGLDKKSSLNLARKLGLNIKQSGIGIVSTQNPTYGQTSAQSKLVELKYAPPKYD